MTVGELSPSIELQGVYDQAVQAETSGEYLSASFLYAKVLAQARHENVSHLIEIAKKKIQEVNKYSRKHYQQAHYQTPIPNDRLQATISEILGDAGKLEDVLRRIGQHPFLMPSASDTRALAAETMPVTFQIASTSAISAENHLIAGGADPVHHWYMIQYGIQQDFITTLYLTSVFTRLRSEHGFDSASMNKYLASVEVYSGEDYVFVATAIEDYFAGRYAQALHILVPRLERVIIKLSSMMGLSTVALQRNKKGSKGVATQDITLSSDLLRKEEFVKCWGSDFCEQLCYVFYDPLGHELRHKIAHGRIAHEECHQSTCNLVLYFYLVLAGRVAVKKSTG